ncbi:Na+/H+ antiporter NhaC family protein [Hathewaya massiliensis]|uniref:Na+/H+ antiporter NhaC family protein n=1 Tax=Hathewaya massiliensis TaxID=1964382 RepID=UPI0011582F48|nr:Na+/H+ antiporter NhaC family protein [Hathewaya massiliensis]
MGTEKNKINRGNPVALLPMGVFLVLYLATSIITRDFYKMPVIIALLAACIVAFIMNPKESIDSKLELFCKGAGNLDIIIMLLIFIFSGAFASVAKSMGAVESTVNLGLKFLPSNILIAGVFLIASFISLSIGTSMGTIAALAPIAMGIAEKIGVSSALAMGAVVGGSMFGDNLSMLSDTTIAAVRTQSTNMKEKFKINLYMVIPAVVITTIILVFMTRGAKVNLTGNYEYNIIKVIPYIVVLVGALSGINVLTVLATGVGLAGIIGMATKSFGIWEFLKAANDGILGMSELIIISMLVAGLVQIISHNGGIDYMLYIISKKMKSKRGAELGIAFLVSLVDLCTANNTVSIVITGSIAKNVSEEYGISGARTASILDIFSCAFQGIIPYGAQLLLASTLSKLSPIEIMRYLHYPYLMCITAIVFIAIGFPKEKNLLGVLEKEVATTK